MTYSIYNIIIPYKVFIDMTKSTFPIKQHLAKITSKQGLIVGSVLGVITSAVSVYYLVPIFEKSENNAAEIITVSATLEDTTQKYQQTSEELTTTSQNLETSNNRVAELEPLQGQLSTANEQITGLEKTTQQNSRVIDDLESQVSNKNSDITALNNKAEIMKDTIIIKDQALSMRREWIDDLKKRDDKIVESAMHLVENFMKIAGSNDQPSATRDKLLGDTLTLVNKLDSQRNTRKLFVKEINEKLQE